MATASSNSIENTGTEITFSNNRVELIAKIFAAFSFLAFFMVIVKDDAENLLRIFFLVQIACLAFAVFYVRHLQMGIKSLTIAGTELRFQFFSATAKILHIKPEAVFVKTKGKRIEFFRLSDNKSFGHAFYFELEEKERWVKMNELLKPCQRI